MLRPKLQKARVSAGPLSPQDLAVIVGLPRIAAKAAAAHVETLSTRWRAVAEPFNKDRGRLYEDKRGLFEFMQTACAFIRDLGQTTPPRPARLIVFYVEDASDQALFDAFGFSALFVKLELEDWHWPNGKHWSSVFPVVREVVEAAVARTEAEPLHGLRLRLERSAADEALLLPPRNFQQADRSDLTGRFAALSRTGTLHEDTFADLAAEVFDYQTLPRFFAKVKDISNTFRVDHRDLVFARSFSGQHGYVRLAEIPDQGSVDMFRTPLESAFRFGTPLRDGFQHDVQWRGRAKLANEPFFDAAKNKQVPISGSHANIYASDHVT